MKDDHIDGYISTISIPIDGKIKTFKLRCEVVEIYPMTCTKCGGRLELKYGTGKCPYCGTTFTTHFKVEEVKE